MKYRVIASALLVLIVLGLYVFASKGDNEAASTAPPAAAQTDDNQFKGLGK